jgi:hypothetical protein
MDPFLIRGPQLSLWSEANCPPPPFPHISGPGGNYRWLSLWFNAILRVMEQFLYPGQHSKWILYIRSLTYSSLYPMYLAPSGLLQTKAPMKTLIPHGISDVEMNIIIAFHRYVFYCYTGYGHFAWCGIILMGGCVLISNGNHAFRNEQFAW